MVHNEPYHDNHEAERTEHGRKRFTRFMLFVGILLLLTTCFVSAGQQRGCNRTPPQTLNGTAVPVIQTLNVTTILPTQTVHTAVVHSRNADVTAVPAPGYGCPQHCTRFSGSCRKFRDETGCRRSQGDVHAQYHDRTTNGSSTGRGRKGPCCWQ